MGEPYGRAVSPELRAGGRLFRVFRGSTLFGRFREPLVLPQAEEAYRLGMGGLGLP